MLSNPAWEAVAGSNSSYTPFCDFDLDLDLDSGGGEANATSYRITGQYADADVGLQYHPAAR